MRNLLILLLGGYLIVIEAQGDRMLNFGIQSNPARSLESYSQSGSEQNKNNLLTPPTWSKTLQGWSNWNSWNGWNPQNNQRNEPSSRQDFQSQLNMVMGPSGQKVSLPDNFIKDKLKEALKESNKQFGNSWMAGGMWTNYTYLDLNSPGDLSNKVAGTQLQSLNIAKDALVLEQFCKSISQKLNLNRQRAATALSQLKISPSEASALPLSIAQALSRRCVEEVPVVPVNDFLNPRTLPPCANNKYRTHTGECNNICFPKRGSASSFYIRHFDPDYSDGLKEPRMNSQNQPLPSARLVSSTLVTTKSQPAPTWTAMFTQFGQFMNHDLTQAPRPRPALECCHSKKPHPECFTIDIPANDPFYGQFGERCMEFVRTLPGHNPGCRMCQREQTNQLSSFIDANQIYGIDPQTVKALRQLSGGRLKTVSAFSDDPTTVLLPPASANQSSCAPDSQKACFFAGDASRCNMQIGLQTIHTIWVRHHNNLVDKLQILNREWEDEKLYQEARAIVAAQLQHITYGEWLPILLGPKALKSSGISLITSGRFKEYDVTVNPGISNEFAAAAFRVGHSMVTGKYDRLAPNFDLKSSVPLRDTFFKTKILYEEGAVDEVTRGLLQQRGKIVENSVTADLSQQLFHGTRSAFGFDLVSFNIQRGRDHGIHGYMQWRSYCRLPTATNFSQLKKLDAMPEDVVNRLASLYQRVEDIDLFPAGISEHRAGDGIIGATFACIISEQFLRLRVGDRFWYENELPLASSLSNEQLSEIKRTSFAKILCETVQDLQSIQPNVFATPSDSNPRLQCSQLPSVDLSPWANV